MRQNWVEILGMYTLWSFEILVYYDSMIIFLMHLYMYDFYFMVLSIYQTKLELA